MTAANSPISLAVLSFQALDPEKVQDSMLKMGSALEKDLIFRICENNAEFFPETGCDITTLFSIFQLGMEKLDVAKKRAILEELKNQNPLLDRITAIESLFLEQGDLSSIDKIEIAIRLNLNQIALQEISKNPSKIQSSLQRFLSIAVASNAHRVIVPLIERGAMIQDNHISEAILQNYPAVLAAFLDSGISADHVISHSYEDTIVSLPMVIMAVFKGHIAIVELLLERGTKINTVTQQGDTLLHIAALQGHKNVAKFLLEREVPINVGNHAGNTPLHLAALKGHENVARLLIEQGANTAQKNLQGHTPEILAFFSNHPNITALILEHNAKEIDRRIQLMTTTLKKHVWIGLQHGLRHLLDLLFFR